jgi:hypothetical protein
MRTLLILLAAVASAAALLTGCGGSSDQESEGQGSHSATTSGPHPLPQGSEPVELDPANFVSRIDNPYWPMSPGSKWVYREGDQRVEVTVTKRSKEIVGIDATVVHDVLTEDGELVEDTWDWYAQDTAGNIWYLGEDTKEYENGKVKTTEGSWEAGVDGAQAGVIVPASPKVGMTYRQEYYRGQAEDAAEILSLDERAAVPFGSFDHVLKTKDYTPLEPDLIEHKFYAKGIGPVLTVTVSGGGDREELIQFTTRQ